MFVIGEWVRRKADGLAGIVLGIEVGTNEYPTLYRVALKRFPRSVHRDDDIVLGSQGAWERYHRVHAHVEVMSADCDGSYSRGHTDVMSMQERRSGFGDLEFKERVLASTVSVLNDGVLTVTEDGLSWEERTEEGYRHVEVMWCIADECAEGYSYSRDHRAEEMGY